MYDTYISLGNNCETAFQIRRILGKDSSSFFSWNVTMFKPLISLLRENFHGILRVENLTNDPAAGLMHDSSHNFKMHSEFQTEDYQSEDNFEKKFLNLVSKKNYLMEKFRTDQARGQHIAYFYKTEEKLDVRENALAVSELLRQVNPNREIALIILQNEAVREPEWDAPGIFNRYLKRIAPWNDATDGHVSSWDKVFREFPHKDGLRLAGF